jgi:UrcA family protein
MLKSSVNRYAGLCGVAGAVAVAIVSAPAFGQGPAGEFTVLGSSGHAAGSVSALVSYGGLDLTTPDGRAALHKRVQRTAAGLCRRIGEDHLGAGSGAPSCEEGTVLSAASQERDVIGHANAQTFDGSPSGNSFVLTMNGATR